MIPASNPASTTTSQRRRRAVADSRLRVPDNNSLADCTAPADAQFIYYVLTGIDGTYTFTTNLAGFLVVERRFKEVFGR